MNSGVLYIQPSTHCSSRCIGFNIILFSTFPIKNKIRSLSSLINYLSPQNQRFPLSNQCSLFSLSPISLSLSLSLSLCCFFSLWSDQNHALRVWNDVDSVLWASGCWGFWVLFAAAAANCLGFGFEYGGGLYGFWVWVLVCNFESAIWWWVVCVGCSAVVGCLPVWVWVFSGFGEWWWWAVEGFFWVLMFVVDGGG